MHSWQGFTGKEQNPESVIKPILAHERVRVAPFMRVLLEHSHTLLFTYSHGCLMVQRYYQTLVTSHKPATHNRFPTSGLNNTTNKHNKCILTPAPHTHTISAESEVTDVMPGPCCPEVLRLRPSFHSVAFRL